MYRLLFIAFLPQISAIVDCKVACNHCKEKKDHPLVLEVHCAMCNECKQRRDSPGSLARDGMELVGANHEALKDTEDVPSEESEECPTPPPCESEEEIEVRKSTQTTTTTTTVPTTTKKQCPPVLTCRKKKRKKCGTPCLTPCAMPCMPMCMNQCPQQQMLMQPMQPMQPLTWPAPPTTTPVQTSTDYYYVYVGVPKNLMNN